MSDGLPAGHRDECTAWRAVRDGVKRVIRSPARPRSPCCRSPVAARVQWVMEIEPQTIAWPPVRWRRVGGADAGVDVASAGGGVGIKAGRTWSQGSASVLAQGHGRRQPEGRLVSCRHGTRRWLTGLGSSNASVCIAQHYGTCGEGTPYS